MEHIKVTRGTFICAHIEVYEYTNRILCTSVDTLVSMWNLIPTLLHLLLHFTTASCRRRISRRLGHCWHHRRRRLCCRRLRRRRRCRRRPRRRNVDAKTILPFH